MINRFDIVINSIFRRVALKRKSVKISLLSMFDSKCEFEDNIFIDRFNIIHTTKIGRYTYITNNCEIANCGIGRFCSIASGVKIGLGNHPTHLLSTSPIFYSFNNRFGVKWANNTEIMESLKTTIGNDVWIGSNVLIKDGLIIGDGAVIGAGAIVTKNIPPYAIAVGNPAKVIKFRFDESRRELLLQSAWWEKDDDELRKIAGQIDNIEQFISNIEESYGDQL
ncbi:MAG: CatB-related O-acetyltransferase [Saccharofermentanales bacterium]